MLWNIISKHPLYKLQEEEEYVDIQLLTDQK